jgi:transcriptional regulator with XRE-family HTH domain
VYLPSGRATLSKNEMVPMDAEVNPVNRKVRSAITVAVNGQKLQALRQQAGLTQEELAGKSGYTDRLIRKAEASSPLRKATIIDLAEALSNPQYKVTIADLTFSHETLANEMSSLLLNGSSGFAEALKEFAHSKLDLHVAGQELGIPFAGTFKGLSSCNRFRDQLVQSFRSVRLLAEQTRSFTSPGEVCIHAVTEIEPSSPSQVNGNSVLVWWFLKVKFESNLISSLELMYDTGNICRLLERFSN